METMVNEDRIQIELKQYEAIDDLRTLGLIEQDGEGGWGKLTDAGRDAVVRVIKDYTGFLEDIDPFLRFHTVSWLMHQPEKIGTVAYALMLLSLR